MTTSHDDIHRDIGRMEGRLGAVEDRLGKMEAVLERIDDRLAKIEAREIERKGAWKAISMVAATIGALVTAIIQHFVR